MKFYEQRKHPPSVPIISLIDILAILLIFFIVTTTFKQKHSQVKVSLPKSSEMASTAAKEEPMILAVTPDNSLVLGDESVTIENLTETLKRLKAGNPEVKLELKADKEVSLGFLVEVWDAASKAGVRVTELPLRILLEKGGSGAAP